MFETSVCPLYLPIFSCSHCLRLNRTITELLTNETISSEEFGNLSVVVKLPPFAEPNSFIVQVKGNVYGTVEPLLIWTPLGVKKVESCPYF